VILVREETSPEDIHGMHAARGIITARGGMTSHAAVVARGMGRACVSGAGDVSIFPKEGLFRVRGREFKAGEIITIDGSTGEILAGSPKMIEPELTGDFATLMEWADAARRMKVRANAETPLDAKTARQFGAEGIGLCRTEHMFFDDTRIAAVREMILADDEAGRRTALAKIAPFQKADFVELFTIMEGLPVTIRLLDPPLHEFLPHTEEDVVAVAKATGLDAAKLMRGPRNCTRPTRCWATAAAAWASRIPRSTRCRSGPSSRPPATSPSRARPRRSPRSCTRWSPRARR
jgi:pyruvate,orthophosphate dikinase